MIKKVAIVTNGGDAPGLNAVINAIVKTAEKHGVEVYGYLDGYKGILENRYIRLDPKDNCKGIISRGGTIIGTSNNVNLFRIKDKDENGNTIYKDMSDYCANLIKENGFDVIFSLGGDGTQKSARDLSKKGIHFIGIPKTIDNDLAMTDITFGFLTALQTATSAIDRITTTADAHDRIMVLEVMGRYAGWIALLSAIAGDVDACLIPEIPYNLDIVAKKILDERKQNKEYAVVIVSEGAIEKGGDMIIRDNLEDSGGLDNIRLGGVGEYVANRLQEITGIESRSTTLGYIQRGGTPTADDRILSTMYGTKAMEYALDGKYNILVTMKDGKLSCSTLDEVVGENTEIGAPSGNTKESNIRKVPKDSEYIKAARNLGITFGDSE